MSQDRCSLPNGFASSAASLCRVMRKFLLPPHCGSHVGQRGDLEIIHQLPAKTFPGVVERAGGVIRAALQRD